MSVTARCIELIRMIKTEIAFKSKNRDQNLWLFGEWFGKKCCDNSLYLANYVKKHCPEVEVVWATMPKTDVSLLDNSIRLVRINTDEAIDVYRRAGVVFFNQNYKDFSLEGYNFFSGAITVNLWHGAQWKKIGYDASKKKGAFHEISVIIDKTIGNTSRYLILSEPYAKCMISAYRIPRNKFLCAGYPRNSIFYSNMEIQKARERLIEILEANGVNTGLNPFFIAYMPTFRDSTAYVFDITELNKNERFISWLNENNVFILQKSHFISTVRSEDSIGQRIFSFNEFSATHFLAASDMLITDYSSCFFDYLLLDRPIIHYLYDYDFYRNDDRGLYYNYNDVVCGDVAWNIDELMHLIIENYGNRERTQFLRSQRKNEYMTYETASSCETIVNEIRKMQCR